MRLLTANCPYCHEPVESSVDHINEPIECPSCGKPFEMEIPTAAVSGVREVDAEKVIGSDAIAELPAEQLLLKRHPATFRSHPFAFSLLLGLFGLGVFGAVQGWTTQQRELAIGSLAGVAVVCLVLFVWWVRSVFVTLKVTNNRTILQRGLFSRSVSEVQHDDVRNIRLDQSFAERVFRVGTIGISSAGQSNVEIVAENMPSPSRIIELIRANQR